MQKIKNRLHRVRGQIESVEVAIVEGKSCEEVIPQLLAIKGAIGSAVRAYLEDSLDSCVDAEDSKKMKQVIKTLIKHS